MFPLIRVIYDRVGVLSLLWDTVQTQQLFLCFSVCVEAAVNCLLVDFLLTLIGSYFPHSQETRFFLVHIFAAELHFSCR